MPYEGPSLPPPPAETAEWSALNALAEADRKHDPRSALNDEERCNRLVVEACGIRIDFTRQRCDVATVDRLLALAETQGVVGTVEDTLRGSQVNTTEGRAALHTALRIPPGGSLVVDGVDVAADVHAELDRMSKFCEEVRSGNWRGHTDQPIRAIINIGIGGSNLGPKMAVDALRSFVDPGFEMRFVSNVDPADLDRALTGLDPESTLFVICSKTFTTQETLTNAEAARDWILEGHAGDTTAVSSHMVAVSTAEAAVAQFGIDTKTGMFGFWEWVGGRYSVGSAIGLSLMLAIGPARFRDFLAGMREMDEHFRTAPADHNLPILLALTWLWNGSILAHDSVAVLPYSSDLHLFPSYLQQLDMESNGKRVRADGTPVGVHTGPVVWGESGTDGQHAFHQLLHQGTRVVPCDLIGFARSIDPEQQDRQDLLMANLIAQAEALSIGRTEEEAASLEDGEHLAAHRTFPGGRPVTVILAKQLDPLTLGKLVALYEHKVLVEAAIWGTNPFDQWGVELGKEMAEVIAPELRGSTKNGHDVSTDRLIDAVRELRSN